VIESLKEILDRLRSLPAAFQEGKRLEALGTAAEIQPLVLRLLPAVPLLASARDAPQQPVLERWTNLVLQNAP
jgi:hypothetical protein